MHLLGGGALGEVHQVDRRATKLDQLGDGFVQRRFAVLEIERHGTDGAAHAGHFAAGEFGHLLFDGRSVAERRRHEQESCLLEHAQGDLPGDAALAVAVVVELVHDHEFGGDAVMGTLRGFPNPPAMVRRRRGRGPKARGGRGRVCAGPEGRRAPHARAAQGHVRQDFGRADQDGRVAVHRGIAGDQTHVLGTEGAAQVEELFVHQRLDRAAIEPGLALAQGLVQERRGHQRLARARGRGQHDVLAGQDLEQRLFLRGIERQPKPRHVIEKALEDLVAARRHGRGCKRSRPRMLIGHVRRYGWTGARAGMSRTETCRRTSRS